MHVQPTSRGKPTETVTDRRALSVGQARDLAGDLVRALAEHIGDADQIDVVLLRWLDELDPRDLGLVALAALQTMFRDCLTQTDPADWPPRGIAFTPANREDTP